MNDKVYKELLVNWLTKYLLTRIDFRDSFLEIIMKILNEFINSSNFDNQLLDLIVMAVYSEDVYKAIEDIITGIPDDDLSRLKLLEKPYFFYLDYFFSRPFRKLMIHRLIEIFYDNLQYFIIILDKINFSEKTLDVEDIKSNFILKKN